MKRALYCLVFCLVGIAPPSAKATAVYTYTGNPFDAFIDQDPPTGAYDGTQRFTIVLTFDRPLAPNGDWRTDPAGVQLLDWSFSDGRVTLTPASPAVTFGFFGSGGLQTDALGRIVTWGLLAYQNPSAGAWATGELGARSFISVDYFVDGKVDLAERFECVRTTVSGGCTGASAFDTGFVLDAPGTWTLSRAGEAPEPGTLALIGLGLAAARSLRGSPRRRRIS